MKEIPLTNREILVAVGALRFLTDAMKSSCGNIWALTEQETQELLTKFETYINPEELKKMMFPDQKTEQALNREIDKMELPARVRLEVKKFIVSKC